MTRTTTMKVSAALVCAALTLMLPSGMHAQTAGTEYGAVLILIGEGDALASERPAEAMSKYREAYEALRKFRKTYPDWQKAIVSFRLEDLASKISGKTASPTPPLASAKRADGPGGLFPKMPAAPRAFVVDVRKDSQNARATAWALQGLINQETAEVFTLNTHYERDVLRHSGKPSETVSDFSGNNAGLRNLFSKYHPRIQKMFLYDPARNWTWYLALMAAAQSNGIPVTETIRNELATEFGWKGEVVDFRERWSNRIEAYDWALTHLMPQCNKQVVFALRMDKRLTDYVAATKGFVFWLDFKKDEERAQIEKIFRAGGYRVGTSLMGYGSNGDFANETANRFGIGYVVSDNYSNGSFWSSFPNKTYTQRPGKVVDAQPGKIYASIMWSDGDNISFDQNPLYEFWNMESRGKVPVATQVAPALQELNSPLLDWYYEKMSDNDELVCGPTGLQFIFIRDFPESQFAEWCRLTRIWCAGAGLRSARIWIAPYPSSKFNTYTTTCGWDGLFGEGWHVKPGLPPKIDALGAGNEEGLFRQFAKVAPDPRQPKFINFTPIVGGFDNLNGGYRAINRVVDRVHKEFPGRYVILLPRDQFATIRHYYITNALSQVSCWPNKADGLVVASNEGDGAHRVEERHGQTCWVLLKSSRLYFKLDERFVVSPATTVEIEIEYFDGPPGTQEGVNLEYDSTNARLPLGGAYAVHPTLIKRAHKMQWQTARFRFSNAQFAGRQNFGADFRFGTGGDEFFIRSVRVRRLP